MLVESTNYPTTQEMNDCIFFLLPLNFKGEKMPPNNHKPHENKELQLFNELFRSHYSLLHNYILKLSNCSEIAKDVVQEAYIKLWNKRQHLDSNLSVENYLFKICHNEFLIYIRKKKKENSLLDELKFDIAQKIYTPFDHTESKINQIEIVLAKLSKRSREAFVLSKVDNLKYTEIAEEMGISVKTVEKHISKALKLFKNTALTRSK